MASLAESDALLQIFTPRIKRLSLLSFFLFIEVLIFCLSYIAILKVCFFFFQDIRKALNLMKEIAVDLERDNQSEMVFYI